MIRLPFRCGGLPGLLMLAAGPQPGWADPTRPPVAERVQVAPSHLPQGVLNPQDGRYVSGSLSMAMLQAMTGRGIRHVVSISPADETPDFEEGDRSRALGLVHHEIPVGGPADLTPAAVAELDRLLDQIGAAPVLLHCASGNRVGALMALRAGWLQGFSEEEALRIGRAHGLTRLEMVVRGRLQDPDAAAEARDSAGSRTDS